MGLFSSRTEQTTDVDVTNENTFAPEITNNIVVEGLELIGTTLRSFLDRTAGAQGNINQTIEGFGAGLTSSIDRGAGTLSQGLRSSGSSIAFAVIAGALIVGSRK